MWVLHKLKHHLYDKIHEKNKNVLTISGNYNIIVENMESSEWDWIPAR